MGTRFPPLAIRLGCCPGHRETFGTEISSAAAGLPQRVWCAAFRARDHLQPSVSYCDIAVGIVTMESSGLLFHTLEVVASRICNGLYFSWNAQHRLWVLFRLEGLVAMHSRSTGNWQGIFCFRFVGSFLYMLALVIECRSCDSLPLLQQFPGFAARCTSLKWCATIQ